MCVLPLDTQLCTRCVVRGVMFESTVLGESVGCHTEGIVRVNDCNRT